MKTFTIDIQFVITQPTGDGEYVVEASSNSVTGTIDELRAAVKNARAYAESVVNETPNGWYKRQAYFEVGKPLDNLGMDTPNEPIADSADLPF